MRSGSRCPAFYGEIPPMRWGILDDDGGYFHCIIYTSSYQDYCEDYESVLHCLDDMDNPLRHEGRTSCYISAK